MSRACALVLLCGVPVASPALVRPSVTCSWLLPCDTPGSGAVGRGLQPEDAVVVFARSCGSVCNKPPTHFQSLDHNTSIVSRMSRQHDTSEVGGAPDRSKDRNSSPGSMVNVAYGIPSTGAPSSLRSDLQVAVRPLSP